jgi:hypothetical protein
MNSSLQLIWLLGDDEVQVLAQHPKQGISGSASIATSSRSPPSSGSSRLSRSGLPITR